VHGKAGGKRLILSGRSITSRHGSGRTKRAEPLALTLLGWTSRIGWPIKRSSQPIPLEDKAVYGTGSPRVRRGRYRSTATFGAETSDESDDRPVTSPGGASERPFDTQPGLNGADVEPEDDGRFGPQPARPGSPVESTAPDCYPSAIDQVEIFADAMTQSVWNEIAIELGADTEAVKEIKRELA